MSFRVIFPGQDSGQDYTWPLGIKSLESLSLWNTSTPFFLFLDLNILEEYRPFILCQFGFVWHFFTVKPRIGLSPGFRKVHTGNVAGMTRYLSLSGLLLLLDQGSSHNFKEACPHCFQLRVLAKAGMYLKPKPKLTPKIHTLFN